MKKFIKILVLVVAVLFRSLAAFGQEEAAPEAPKNTIYFELLGNAYLYR